jgi:hypothetical protein
MTPDYFIPRSVDLTFIDELAELASAMIPRAELVHYAGSADEIEAHKELLVDKVTRMQRIIELFMPVPEK